MNRELLKKRFLTFCDREDLIHPGDTVVIGFSGGPDSVCLLYLLNQIAGDRDIRLVAAHIHHGIRGEEADRDAIFSRNMSEKLGIPYEERHVDAPGKAREEGLTLEEAARILRYEQLRQICEKYAPAKIALAHHADDRAETILMNLFRGTGVAGLTTMTPCSPSGIRPLLFVGKKEIIEYLQENNIDYVEDSTNFNPDHTRNRIRHELLPLIEEMYPRASEHLLATADDLCEWERYLEAQADRAQVKGKEEAKSRIVISEYKNHDPVIQILLLRRVLKTVIPGVKDVSRKHYDELMRMIEDPLMTGTSLSLPQGVRAVRTHEYLEFVTGEPGKPEYFEVPLVIPGETDMPELSEKWVLEANVLPPGEKKVKIFQEKDYTKYFDYDKIGNSVLLRNPKEGDFFTINRAGERKKLSRFFIDEKIPREQRAKKLVLADGSHVIWAFPDRISEYYKVTDETRRVLKITRRKGVTDEGMHS